MFPWTHAPLLVTYGSAVRCMLTQGPTFPESSTDITWHHPAPLHPQWCHIDGHHHLHHQVVQSKSEGQKLANFMKCVFQWINDQHSSDTHVSCLWSKSSVGWGWAAGWRSRRCSSHDSWWWPCRPPPPIRSLSPGSDSPLYRENGPQLMKWNETK